MNRIEKLVILGGGTAGWMTAAALSRFLSDGRREIILVESDEIGIVGVGEATIPPIRDFNHRLGIDERAFIRETGATIKLGIEFVGWGKPQDRYLHPFGKLGHDFQGVDFHQYWLKHRQGVLGDYWLASHLVREGSFAPPQADPRSPLSGLAYAFHFDAGLYAAFLRRQSEAQGTRRIEGKVAGIERDPHSGDVSALLLADGRRVEGDFFVDCSGFRSLLLGAELGTPYIDWTRWLPCDCALAVPSERTEPLLPVTRSTAMSCGWQWRIPLQHRTGNGLVYSSAHIDDDDAQAHLLSNLDGKVLGDPRSIRFTAGMRKQFWAYNVVAIGLSSGFIEPLESTSIHLIQTGIARLLFLFPGAEEAAPLRAEYNRIMCEQYEFIRDFIVLHYHANQRDDSDFWRDLAAMEIPDSLAEKLELFQAGGRIRHHDHDLFAPHSWAAVLIGQNILPQGYDPMVDSMDDAKICAAMEQIQDSYRHTAQSQPKHAEALARLI